MQKKSCQRGRFEVLYLLLGLVCLQRKFFCASIYNQTPNSISCLCLITSKGTMHQILQRNMAAPESQAVTTNQGNSSICTCAALAMAATEGGHFENSFCFQLALLLIALLTLVTLVTLQRHVFQHLMISELT